MTYPGVVKRWLDVCLASTALIVLSPLLFCVATVIKITSHGSVLYKQERVGKHSRPFLIYKFRTMKPFSDQEGMSTKKNDPRITLAGKFLRLMSLDELPQLMNIIKGEMSLVGPRPATFIQAKNYSKEDWAKRHQVRPGITGLAQVNGRSSLDFPSRLMYDLRYVESVSFMLDVKISLRTLAIAFNPLTAN